MKELTEKEKRDFLEWSEGNQYLYDLLCVCCENEISTFASCGGHESGYSNPYIGIILNNNSLSFMKNILNHLQDMQNISITSGVRGPREHLFDDKELRCIVFYPRNHNCCEMFYKIKKGIEDKNQNVTLTKTANKFYDSLRRLNETSREKLQEDINDNVLVGNTFSTHTQDFIDYQMIRNSKIIRFFRKLLPFRKENNKYEQLQHKYGFLQRNYSEEQHTRTQQYRIEKTDNQENQYSYSKKVKDVEPIETGSATISKKTLHEFIEEPCLDACKYLYDLNIQTTMSSANKKDVGGYGYIHIALDSLSAENQQILLKMLEKSEDRISLGIEHGSIPTRIISIKTPITEKTTIRDAKNGFLQIISALKIQDVLYGRYSREEIVNYIKKCYGQDLEINDELIKDIGFCYCSDEDVYFENEELLNKHLKYINRESNLER